MQQEMQYIYTVYEKGSFTKAAQALYLSQPALSIAVQKVEQEIGMPVFNRDKKPLELTEAGKLYIRKIEQIRTLEDELAAELHDLTELQTGSLTIGGTHYFNAYILPPVLAAYKNKFPGIELKIVEAGSWELLDMLKDNKIDLTFNCTPNPADKLRRAPSFQDTILLAVPNSFPITQKMQAYALSKEALQTKAFAKPECPTVSLQEFAAIPFIVLTPHNNLYNRSMSFFQEAGITPNITLKVAQLVTSFHLARAGIGATFISDWMLTHPYPEMSYYKLSSPLAVRIFDIVTPGKSYLSKAQRAFIRLFQQHYQAYMYASK